MKKKNIATLLIFSSAMVISSIASSSFVFNNTIKNTFKSEKNIGQEPVAYIVGRDTRYTSIEKALDVAQSGDIVMVVPPTLSNYNDQTNKNTPDKVTYEITRNCVIKSGVSLVLPTDTETISGISNQNTLKEYLRSMDTEKRSSSKDDPSLRKGSDSTYLKEARDDSAHYLRVTVKVADNVTITNQGNLIISGYLSGGSYDPSSIGQTSHSYARIVLGNNSKIIQNNSSANTYCYGYIEENIKDNNSIFSLQKGNLYVPFVVRDFRGFNYSWAMTDPDNDAINTYNCSPFNQHDIRNIFSNLEIKDQGLLKGVVNFYIYHSSAKIYMNFTVFLDLVGKSNSCFIKLNDESGSYLLAKYDSTDKKNKLDFYGGFKLSNLALSLDAGFGSFGKVDLNTRNAYFPISYNYDITLHSSNEDTSSNVYDFSSQMIKLLPGSRLFTDENITINANEIIVYSAFYDGSLGNNEDSVNDYNAVKYPLKEGAEFIVSNSTHINSNKFAGTIYSDNSENIVSNSNSIVSHEAWDYGNSGKISPQYTINEYLEIHETLAVVPIENLNKNKLFIANNIFSKNNKYLPSISVSCENNVYTVDGVQKVLFIDEENELEIKFLANIWKALYNETRLEKNAIIEYNQTKPFIGLINSKVSILSNNNGINEFDVQSVNVKCSDALVDGKIPLYVNGSVQFEAEVVDIEKVYNKEITWRTSNEDVATVDSNGKVFGKKAGTVTIEAECDGVIGKLDVEVLQDLSVVSVESVYVTDNRGGSSLDEPIGTFAFNGETIPYFNKQYSKGTTLVISANIVPEDGYIKSLYWEYYDVSVNTGKRFYKYGDSSKTKQDRIDGDTKVCLDIDTSAMRSPDNMLVRLTVVTIDSSTGEDKTIVVNYGVCQESDVCFSENTLITMADGKQKLIGDIQKEDKILVYDPLKGGFTTSNILMIVKHPISANILIKLIFDDNSFIEFIGEHELFSSECKKFIEINPKNVSSYLNSEFVVEKNYSFSAKKLINFEVKETQCISYSLISYKYLNVIANNFLTMSPNLAGTHSYIEIDEDMKMNVETFKNDIRKYGLYSYEDWADMVPYEIFDGFNMKYFKIPIGKKKMTYNDVLKYIEMYKEFLNDGEIE